jgi:hypothetical protein
MWGLKKARNKDASHCFFHSTSSKNRLRGRSEARTEFSLSVRLQENLELPLLSFGKSGASVLDLVTVSSPVLHRQRAAAAHLEPVAEGRPGCESVSAEAGAGVIDFEELNWCSGLVLDRSVNVVRAAGQNDEQKD